MIGCPLIDMIFPFAIGFICAFAVLGPFFFILFLIEKKLFSDDKK